MNIVLSCMYPKFMLYFNHEILHPEFDTKLFDRLPWRLRTLRHRCKPFAVICKR